MEPSGPLLLAIAPPEALLLGQIRCAATTKERERELLGQIRRRRSSKEREELLVQIHQRSSRERDEPLGSCHRTVLPLALRCRHRRSSSGS